MWVLPISINYLSNISYLLQIKIGNAAPALRLGVVSSMIEGPVFFYHNENNDSIIVFLTGIRKIRFNGKKLFV